MLDIENIAKNWIEAQCFDVDEVGYKERSWAVDKCIEMAISDPDNLFEIVKAVFEANSSQKILESLGAGPLEDLMVYHGNLYISIIEDYINLNPEFKEVVRKVRLDSEDVSSDVLKKFIKISE